MKSWCVCLIIIGDYSFQIVGRLITLRRTNSCSLSVNRLKLDLAKQRQPDKIEGSSGETVRQTERSGRRRIYFVHQ